MADFQVSFSIKKEFLKKKVNWAIAFGLISFFHVQIQEPESRSTTIAVFVFLAKFIKNIWNENSMTTYAFAWMGVAHVDLL